MPLNWLPRPTVVNGAIIAGQRLAVGSSATSFASFSNNSDMVTMQVNAGDIYASLDGTTPSASNGFYLYSGNVYNWHPLTARYAQFIEVSSSASIQAYEFECADDVPSIDHNNPIAPKGVA